MLAIWKEPISALMKGWTLQRVRRLAGDCLLVAGFVMTASWLTR